VRSIPSVLWRTCQGWDSRWEGRGLDEPRLSRRSWLRPADAGCGRVDGRHLPGPGFGEHVRRAFPLGRDHEERRSLVAAERTGEAAAVELDRLQHFGALADADAALAGDVAEPDRAVGVEADPVGDAVAEVGPEAP